MPIQVADVYRDGTFAQRQTGLLFNLPVPDPSIEQKPEGISLCMIVKNEERFLAECLESLKDVVDEINIVDTGSTDRTVEIARSYGAKIEFREWRNDFSWARNESLAMATKRWIIVLDADEELERESIPLLRSIRTVPADVAAVYIDIVNLIDDQTGASTMSHRLLRLFPNTPRLRYTQRIHESLSLDETGKGLNGVISPIRILHKGYTAEMLKARGKDTRNRPLVAAEYEENSDDLFAMFNFGNAAICAGNTDVGIACLERMLELADAPKIYFPLAYVMLAQAYAEALADNDRGLDAIERGLAIFSLDAGLIFTKGQILAKQGKTAEARELYHQALSLRELMLQTAMTDDEIFQWKIYSSFANSYERDKNYDEAVVWIDKAIANKPNSVLLQRAKAQLLERAGRQYEAELAYRRVAEIEPRVGGVDWVNYLLRRGRFAEALRIIEADTLKDLSPVALAQLNVAAARAAMATGTNDPVPFLAAALRYHPASGSALALYEKVLTDIGDTAGLDALHARELAATCVDADDFCRRSYRLLALERFADARAAAESGLEIEPSNAELRFNLSMALLGLGDGAAAENELARIEEHHPDVFTAGMQWLASLQLKRGERARAAETIERWLAADAQNARTVVSGAQILVQGGARDEARALLEAHVDVDRSVSLELASMYLQDGDLAAAGRVAENALR
jgi:glycosyltransferase involved in cell wall biosynthesis/Tfp pilus assembly protein PilF